MTLLRWAVDTVTSRGAETIKKMVEKKKRVKKEKKKKEAPRKRADEKDPKPQ